MDEPLAPPGPLEPPTCDDRAVRDVWLSRLELPAVRLADELGLFGRLGAGPAPAAAVAAALDLGPRGAAALLAVGAALGFLTQHGGRFGLTAAARHFLLRESDFDWGAMLHPRRGQVDPLHDALQAALRRDARPVAAAPADQADARPVSGWARGQVDAAQARETTARLHAHSFPAALGAARHGDFAGFTRLLDVGGGSGCVAIALAQRHPGLRCTVLELPAVCPVAAEYVARYAGADRVDTRPADMFVDPWPRRYDAVFFGNILHDWDAPRREALARKSFAALPPGGASTCTSSCWPTRATAPGPPRSSRWRCSSVRTASSSPSATWRPSWAPAASWTCAPPRPTATTPSSPPVSPSRRERACRAPTLKADWL